METDRLRLVSKLSKALLKINALKIGTFTTHEGKTSPYFIDLRKLPSYSEAYLLAVSCLEKSLLDIGNEYESLCGVPLSGLLLCNPIAVKLHKSLIYPGKGSRRKVQGILRPGSRVLVVDDVSETGTAIKSAVLAVRFSGGLVDKALTLIDRLEGAKESLRKIGVELHSFTDTGELGGVLQDNMALSEEEEKAIESKPKRI